MEIDIDIIEIFLSILKLLQLENSVGSSCDCQVRIAIEEDIQPPVYFYYKLTNFYQNHRLYVKSRDNAIFFDQN